jgi:Reverse transcriptase (RNA-dependent DNA polymerase)
VVRPTGAKVLPGRWVYKAKRGPDGTVTKYKARWVVKGFQQQYGIDYNETYAAVVKAMSYRTVYVLSAAKDYEIEQMDFITAFLNGRLDDIVYVEQPHGYEDSEKVCLLFRALYGLKQSPRVWYETLYEFLITIGFIQTHADHSIFIHPNGIIIAVYVDDLQIFGPSIEDICFLKKQLTNRFKMTDLGPASYYLGIQITRDRERRSICLSQEAYIARVLQAMNMTDCQPVSTLMELGLDLQKEMTPVASLESIKKYQSAIGLLMYAMLSTRPDLAFAVSTLSQFATNPGDKY